MRVANIVVFDSGIGGLSVYNEIYHKIPHANFTYLFDNEGFPYGDKSNEFLVERVQKVILTASTLFPIDLVVIACNTASTICLPSLRERFSFPIVGVVPAIKPATLLTQNGCIGLLATKATINRAYTHQLINDFAKQYTVKLLGISELALMAEEKLQGDPVDVDKLTKLMQPWLTLPVIPDTIVLGCTHYPFIKDELQSLFPNSTFVDSGYAIADRVYSLLKDQFLINEDSAYTYSIENQVCSTLYNEQVIKTLLNFEKYNLNKYQLVNI